MRNTSIEKNLRSLLRRVKQERSLGAMSTGRAHRRLAADYALAQRNQVQLPQLLKEATESALQGPVRTFASRTTWQGNLSIYQPHTLVQAPTSLKLLELLQGYRP